MRHSEKEYSTCKLYFFFAQIIVAGGRYFKGGATFADPVVETYTSSCEMFHLRTKTWTKCNDLPYPLAFATVISTPKGAWILGGKTSPVDRASVKMNLNDSFNKQN